MKKLIALGFILIVACPETSSLMISFESVQALFTRMHENGIDTDRDKLYGYYFTHHSKTALEKAATALQNQGFTLVDIAADETGHWWLHVERIEVHTPQSLHALNLSLYQIADTYGLSSYDGYDIGNKYKDKPIERDTYVVPEEFGTADLLQNGLPFLVSANKAFDRFPHKEEFSTFLTITSPYQSNDNKVGLPEEAEMKDLNQLEDLIEKTLERDSLRFYYLGRTIHANEWSIYLVTNEVTPVAAVLKALAQNGGLRPFEFEASVDSNWVIYDKLTERIKAE